jgi:hypothetical protein
MICPLCNREIENESKYCTYCGKKINPIILENPHCDQCGRYTIFGFRGKKRSVQIIKEYDMCLCEECFDKLDIEKKYGTAYRKYDESYSEDDWNSFRQDIIDKMNELGYKDEVKDKFENYVDREINWIEFKKKEKKSFVASYRLDYLGGHPKRESKMNNVEISVWINYFFIQTVGTIKFDDIQSVHYETQEEINHRVTATRLVLLGAFALAAKKREVETHRYLTVDYLYEDVEYTLVLSGDHVSEAYQSLASAFNKYKKENKKEEDKPVEQNTLPYEELKKLKELLDMGVITQEEFDVKKKEMLGI